MSKEHCRNSNGGGPLIERVKKYAYLRTLIPENNNYTVEIKTRMKKACSNFINMKKALCSTTFALKVRFTECYIYSALYYEMEL